MNRWVSSVVAFSVWFHFSGYRAGVRLRPLLCREVCRCSVGPSASPRPFFVKILLLLLALSTVSASAAPARSRKPATRPAAEKGKEKNDNSANKDKSAGKSDSKEEPAAPESPAAKTSSLKPEQLAGFEKLPARTQDILRYALSLTERNLSYKTGSADPDTGGTDCSGFVYHGLQSRGHTAAPRQSNEMYAWTWRAGTFRACNGTTTESFEFGELRPGDLLFWVNSTRDGKTDRNPPVTHVMIYLGNRASDGHPVVAGASDGRTYEGQRMSGVSVFDFKLPAAGSQARFIGYAHLPGEPVPAAPEPLKAPPKKPKTKSGKSSGKN